MTSDGTDQDVYKRLLFPSLVVVVLIDRSITYISTESRASTRDSDSEDGSHPSQQISANSNKRSRREKKEQYRQDQARSRNSHIPATNINATDAGKVRKDLSHITCFNCNETGHYADKCTEPKADAMYRQVSDPSEQPPVDNCGRCEVKAYLRH